MRISTPIFAAAVMLAALSFGARADTSTDEPPQHYRSQRCSLR